MKFFQSPDQIRSSPGADPSSSAEPSSSLSGFGWALTSGGGGGSSTGAGGGGASGGGGGGAPGTGAGGSGGATSGSKRKQDQNSMTRNLREIYASNNHGDGENYCFLTLFRLMGF